MFTAFLYWGNHFRLADKLQKIAHGVPPAFPNVNTLDYHSSVIETRKLTSMQYHWLTHRLFFFFYNFALFFLVQIPPQSVSDHGRRAAVSLPTPAFFLWGWPSNHDHQPLSPQDSTLHGQSHVDQWGILENTVYLPLDRGGKVWERVKVSWSENRST